MFVNRRPTAMGSLGTNWFTNAWNYYFDRKAWNADPDNQAPLSKQEIQAQGNADVRAQGLNPYTNTPLTPLYASNLPSAQADRDALAADIRNKSVLFLQDQFNKNVNDLRNQQDRDNAGKIEWGKVLLLGAGALGATFVVVKMVGR